MALSSCAGSSSKQLSDQEILVKIYEAMNGPNWGEYQSENWLSDKPIGEWRNVEINDEGRVIALSAEIGGLTELEKLFIYSRTFDIDNVIPAEIGKLIKLNYLSMTAYTSSDYNKPLLLDLTSLVNLVNLYIEGFGGAIPENIGQLNKLQILSLEGFDGIIPESICELADLEELFLITYNQPEGAVPDCIGKLSNLKKLKIHYRNGVTGEIKPPNAKFPESIWDLSNLEYLFLRCLSNSGGPIPGDKVAKMTKLKNITIMECGITGTIPAEFFASGKLTELDIRRNKLTGSIPSEIGNCPDLFYVYLTDNQLTGNIPEEFAKCEKLDMLNLSDNQLTGNIPEGFAKCEKLSMLDLSDNQLTGNIPEGLAKCEGLSTLDLSGNQLSPDIPAALKAHRHFSKFKF